MNRLWVRLSILFGVVVLFGAATIAIAAGLLVSERVRDRFLPDQLAAPAGILETLTDYYEIHGSWDGVDTLLSGAQGASHVGIPGGLRFILMDTQDNILFGERWLTDRQEESRHDETRRRSVMQRGRLPIKVNGETVGYLSALPRARGGVEPIPFDMQRWFSRILLTVAAVGTVVGLLFGISASRNVTAPLSRLAAAARTIGSGDLGERVTVSGTDEMQEVARAFNDMADGLEEAERLRRNLVADVAHELRTPLSVIQGNLRAILDDVYPLEKSEISRLYDQTRILNRLVEDLRLVAQAEAGQLPLNLARTNLGQLVQDTVATFEPVAESEGVALTLESVELPEVPIDRTRFSQIMNNLLANALNHTSAGGHVTVFIDQTDREAIVQVSDSGTGIEQEHLPHVFDRFYRTERARDRDSGGTGLGLAIVRALIEAHGGSVDAMSDGLEQGTTFEIRLPLSE